MTVKEFLNKTENMIISDYDLNEETGFVEVNFGGDIYGGINYVFENNGALIFSATPKNNNPRWYEAAHQLDLSEIRELCKGYENLELYYYSKSNGVFSVKNVTQFEYDYSDDGDGHYEACHIECSENPVAKSLDNIEKINVDDYEDFFESLNKKFNESNLKEDVSELKIETLNNPTVTVKFYGINGVCEILGHTNGYYEDQIIDYKLMLLNGNIGLIKNNANGSTITVTKNSYSDGIYDLTITVPNEYSIFDITLPTGSYFIN